MKWLIRLVVFAIAISIAFSQAESTKTDAQIRQEMIKQSIASYRGSCACPYSVDSPHFSSI